MTAQDVQSVSIGMTAQHQCEAFLQQLAFIFRSFACIIRKFVVSVAEGNLSGQTRIQESVKSDIEMPVLFSLFLAFRTKRVGIPELFEAL